MQNYRLQSRTVSPYPTFATEMSARTCFAIIPAKRAANPDTLLRIQRTSGLNCPQVGPVLLRSEPSFSEDQTYRPSSLRGLWTHTDRDTHGL